MATKKKLLQAAAGQAGGAALNVEDVFSTYLYEGNAAGQGATAQSITNNVDLSGEGGLVWIKNRDSGGTNAWSHYLFDTERGATKYVRTNVTNGETTSNNSLSAFNSDGFTLGETGGTNNNGDSYASWTFRKAPKFFTVVTYTGDGTTNRQIPHDLGGTVGHITVKKTSGSAEWFNWHRTFSDNQLVAFSGTYAVGTYSNYLVTADSTTFTVGNNVDVNGSGETYVAYLWGHNDGDGEFGPDGDQDIIKCGSYTGDDQDDGPEIDLGFEPQWLLVKNASTTRNWIIVDNMRGIPTGGNDANLYPNLSNAEDPAQQIRLTPTGFKCEAGGDNFNGNGHTMIYIAIRRGPMAVPESATDVFDIDTHDSTEPLYDTSFPVDFGMYRRPDLTQGMYLGSRMQGAKELRPNATSKEDNNPYHLWDYQNGWGATGAGSSGSYSWMWRRAPNFFDVVAYTGNSTAGRTVSHNLGVAPEMMWVKRRDSIGDWRVYHSGLDATAPQDKYINLNEDLGVSDSTLFWNDTAPTDSNFTLGSHATVNGSGGTYIAYLFASLDGVSKLGTISFTNGSTSSVDCGFSSGARFVLLKSTSATGGWWVFDTERGIVSGNDPYLQLNTTTAQNSSFDIIDPLSSGFQLSGNTLPSDTYIFYAVA